MSDSEVIATGAMSVQGMNGAGTLVITDTAVVVITASAGGAVDSVRAGAIDFVGKPFNVYDLLSTVENAVKRKRPSRVPMPSGTMQRLAIAS